jgi:SOS-response transcriptional repressor LexA
MYIVEAKGEIYSDSQKNYLLEQIDYSKSIGDIEKFKHILAYSGYIDSLENNNISIEEFIRGADNYEINLMAQNDLKKDDEVEDNKKHTEYLPVYSIKNALSKFVEKKEVKNDGWLLEKGSVDNFMIQVKNSTINGYNDLTYIKLSCEVGSDINDRIGLVYYPEIEDEGYGRCYALRKIKLIKNTTLEGMFENTSYDLVLFSENEEYQDLEFKNITQDNFKVIGILKRLKL